ncbi:MAG: hypothetical protein LBP22_04830 [Deltaproteobacteria bacterium]|jgi:hypothetical protein|nr:hypothetical protein [Deltaproteobacteria bacterium]
MKILGLLYWLPLTLAAALVAAIAISSRPDVQYQLRERLSTETMARVYSRLEDVHPSQITARLREIVQDRLRCYGNNPQDRVSGECIRQYLYSLVRVGRSEIYSAPDMGNFLDMVKKCPIVNAVCRGKGQDSDSCISMESLCLDNVMDDYWRGSPFLTVFSSDSVLEVSEE